MKRVRAVIHEWEERELPALKPRDVEINHLLGMDHVIDIIGPRRSGKTYLMYLMISKLLEKIDREAVLYINFENRILYPLTDKLLEGMLNYVYEKKLLEKHGRVFLFFDEIQNVPNWERWVRNVYDEHKGKIKIFISGSSSRLAGKDVSSLLTGRHVPITLLPLNFREFLSFKGMDFKSGDVEYSRKKQAELKNLLDEYLDFGGFPEVVLADSKVKKEEILGAYYGDMLYKYVVEKFKIKEIGILENFLKSLFVNISSYFSYKRANDHLKSLGIQTSTRTLLRYTSILEEVFLTFFVPIFSKKVRDQMRYPRKIYCVDAGLRRTVSGRISEDYGRVMENAVFLSLKGRKSEIYYWKDRQGREVDFVVKEGLKVKQLIQVCKEINNPKTKEREVGGLLKAMSEFNLREGLIITEDFEKEEKIKGKKVTYKPLWKWLVSRRKEA